MKKKTKQKETDAMPFADCMFQITAANEIQLKALTKYAMMLDFVTNSTGDELLNVDGLVNCILDDGMSRRLKELAKKHGFESVESFMDAMNECKDGDEVAACVRESEREAYQRAHDAILAHIPLDDRQMNLFDKTAQKD